MDRQNGFFRQGLPGVSDETADTATPRDRIGKALRDRMFAEEDGVFTEDITPTAAVPAPLPRKNEPPVTRRHLLRQIQHDSIALAQAALHLDTHPADDAVLRHYNICRAHLAETARLYESRYGALGTDRIF